MSIDAKDLLGNPIAVGDTVVISHSNSQKPVVGKVLSISKKQCRIECQVGRKEPSKVKDYSLAAAYKSTKVMPEVVQRNHQNCVVYNTAEIK